MKVKTRKKTAKPEQIVNNAPRTFGEADFPIGSVAHQGDLILVRIESLPRRRSERKERQLAIGNTQGSRHVLDRGDVYDGDAAEVAQLIANACPGATIDRQYLGPVFGTTAGEADLLHPEHGHHHYRGEMTIAVVYQRNLDAEEREARVRD